MRERVSTRKLVRERESLNKEVGVRERVSQGSWCERESLTRKLVCERERESRNKEVGVRERESQMEVGVREKVSQGSWSERESLTRKLV